MISFLVEQWFDFFYLEKCFFFCLFFHNFGIAEKRHKQNVCVLYIGGVKRQNLVK